MKKYRRYVNWWWCFALVFGLITGCHQFDFAENELTFPASGDVDFSSNFSAREQVSKQFAWNEGDGILCVNIPEAGDYLFTYDTISLESLQHSNNPSSDLFIIVFRATAPAQLYVSFSPQEGLNSFMLQRGTVKEQAIGLYDDGPIIRYASPSIPTIFWDDVFVLPPDVPPLSVLKEEFICPPPEYQINHSLQGF